MRDGVNVNDRECWNPKSEYFAKVVDCSFECSFFSDSRIPDPEAEKIILDPKSANVVHKIQRAHAIEMDKLKGEEEMRIFVLTFENLKEKISFDQRKRLSRYAKNAHKFILLTHEDIDDGDWSSSHEVVGLTFGESLNLIGSLLLKLSEDYPDDPEFLDKMRKLLDAWFEYIARLKKSG